MRNSQTWRTGLICVISTNLKTTKKKIYLISDSNGIYIKILNIKIMIYTNIIGED